MARGPQKWNEKTIERLIKEKRGQGTLDSYKPWITVGDFSSKGRSRRAWSPKTEREHHLFSDVEWRLFVLLEWTANVIDIREQFPLDRNATLKIAQELGIPHPYYPGTQTPTVMTVDFLVTRVNDKGQTYFEAFNAKCQQEAENTRSLEKLEIQRSYFEAQNIQHHIVFDTTLPMAKVKNIEWIRDAQLKPCEAEPHPGFYQEHITKFVQCIPLAASTTTLLMFCTQYDRNCGLSSGTALRIARMAMLQREVVINLNSADLCKELISNFESSASTSQSLATRRQA